VKYVSIPVLRYAHLSLSYRFSLLSLSLRYLAYLLSLKVFTINLIIKITIDIPLLIIIIIIITRIQIVEVSKVDAESGDVDPPVRAVSCSNMSAAPKFNVDSSSASFSASSSNVIASGRSNRSPMPGKGRVGSASKKRHSTLSATFRQQLQVLMDTLNQVRLIP
tara:strand:- start:876 stop:1367 length:492 start_codon:yes stop_codon:yes gene_type:complete